jgi:hypothetical protein
LTLESERVLNLQPDSEVEELHAEELQADNAQDQDYEHESVEGHPRLEQLIKLTLVVAACFAVIYSGIAWYEKHQQIARELEIVPPPPTAITGSGIFDIDKAPNSKPQIGGNSQQVSLQSIN